MDWNYWENRRTAAELNLVSQLISGWAEEGNEDCQRWRWSLEEDRFPSSDRRRATADFALETATLLELDRLDSSWSELAEAAREWKSFRWDDVNNFQSKPSWPASSGDVQ